MDLIIKTTVYTCDKNFVSVYSNFVLNEMVFYFKLHVCVKEKTTRAQSATQTD